MNARCCSRSAERRKISRKLSSFLGVGAAGFMIDVMFFFGLTVGFRLPYIWARIIASLGALTATWLMNRASTFADGRIDAAWIEFLRYLAASSAGAGANLVALSIVAPYDQALRHVPAYVIGAAVGLVVNFFLYDKFVFRGHPHGPSPRSRSPEDVHDQ